MRESGRQGLPSGSRRRAVGGFLVVRARRPAELAGRRPIVLTRRDREILAAVHAHGVLTASQIELAFFSGLAGGSPERGRPGAPSGNCYVRLRQLWLWGYLERLEQPLPRGAGGSRPALYALGPRGAPHSGDRDDPDTPRGRPAAAGPARRPLARARLGRGRLLGPPAGPVARGAGRGGGWRWTAERRLRALALGVRDPRTRRWHPFLPDGYFEVEYAAARACGAAAPDWGPVPRTPSRHRPGPQTRRRGPEASPVVQCAVLEVDMGTLPLPRFRRKARAFELALRQGVFARAFGRAEFEVLVLTRGTGPASSGCGRRRGGRCLRSGGPGGRSPRWRCSPLEGSPMPAG